MRRNCDGEKPVEEVSGVENMGKHETPKIPSDYRTKALKFKHFPLEFLDFFSECCKFFSSQNLNMLVKPLPTSMAQAVALPT
jgi:hypothetical protein